MNEGYYGFRHSTSKETIIDIILVSFIFIVNAVIGYLVGDSVMGITGIGGFFIKGFCALLEIVILMIIPLIYLLLKKNSKKGTLTFVTLLSLAIFNTIAYGNGSLYNGWLLAYAGYSILKHHYSFGDDTKNDKVSKKISYVKCSLCKDIIPEDSQVCPSCGAKFEE